MPANGQVVKFNYYTRAKFNSLSSKDNNTMYYVEETGGKIKQYIGNTLVVSDITKAEIEAKLTGNITTHTHSQYLLTTGKASDSNKLNGLELNSTTTNNQANKVMRTDASGYANFGWIKTTSGNTTDPVTDVYVNTTGGWIYRKSLPLFKAELGEMPPTTHSHTGIWKQVYSGPSGALSETSYSNLTLTESATYYNRPMMMEIKYGANNAVYTSQIVTFNVGTNSTTGPSKTYPRSVSITDFDGRYLKTISAKVHVSTTGATSTLRVGPVTTLIGDFTSSSGTLTWTTESSDNISVYIGKIWVME